VIRLPRAVISLATSKLRSLTFLLVAAVLGASLSGCALDRRKKIYDVTEQEIAAGGEPYFFAGPITYQVQISRQLNPFSTEDVQYLAGIKYAQKIAPNQLWFGIFLRALNQSGHTATTSDTFTLHDSAGTVFHPVKLNPSINPFAWTSQTLAPNAIEPNQDSIAYDGPTQGGLILFLVNQSIYANRPLTLYVYPGHGRKPSLASLDL
jgi:hypothetical protein